MRSDLRGQLQRALERSGMSISELARRLGYSDHNVVSRYLIGVRELKGERIEAWAEATGYRIALVPEQPSAVDLDAVAAPLPDDQRELLARLAAVMADLPDGAIAALEHLVTGWEQTRVSQTPRNRQQR